MALDVHVVWEDNGVSPTDRDAAANAVAALDRQLSGTTVRFDGETKYRGDPTTSTDRRALYETVDEWLKSTFARDAVAQTMFLFLTDCDPLEYVTDLFRTGATGPVLGAGVTPRTVGVEGMDGYAHGLAVVNTYVTTFVDVVPVPYEPGSAVEVTVLHEMGHGLTTNVDAENDHCLGAQLERDDTGVTTPLLYWYDDQLAFWANNPNETADAWKVETHVPTAAATEFSQAALDEIAAHLDTLQ